MLLMLMLAGKTIFNLPYDNETDFIQKMYTPPYDQLQQQQINKTTIYTMVF